MPESRNHKDKTDPECTLPKIIYCFIKQFFSQGLKHISHSLTILLDIVRYSFKWSDWLTDWYTMHFLNNRKVFIFTGTYRIRTHSLMSLTQYLYNSLIYVTLYLYQHRYWCTVFISCTDIWFIDSITYMHWCMLHCL